MECSDVEIVLINSDTLFPQWYCIPIHPKNMGLNGRGTYPEKPACRNTAYYYPGILDSLLHIDFTHQLLLLIRFLPAC
jgi:hypothetical protein